MIYRIGDKVKFKVAHSIKNGIILEKSTLVYPYHVRSEDNNDYWINEDSIFGKEPKTKYKVGDRVKFRHFLEHVGTIVRVYEDDSNDRPYLVSCGGSHYPIKEDEILYRYRNNGEKEEPELKYKVNDRVIFKFEHGYREHTGVIVHVEDDSKYPYKIRDDHDGSNYFANDDNILGYRNSRNTDYTSFYYGRRQSKSVEPKWDSLPDDGVLYCKKDVEVMTDMYRRILDTGAYLPKIKKVIFNDPATIVFWKDGTKTVVKAQTSVTGQAFADGQHLIDLTKTDLFDPEKGLAMAIAKKALGNDYNYYNKFKKWLPKEEKNG